MAKDMDLQDFKQGFQSHGKPGKPGNWKIVNHRSGEIMEVYVKHKFVWISSNLKYFYSILFLGAHVDVPCNVM